MVRDLESRTRLPGSATRNIGLYTARILRLARAAGTYVSASLIGQLASPFPQHRKTARHSPMVRDLESRTRLPGSATRNIGLYTARILRLARAAGTYVSASLIGQLASAFPQHRQSARPRARTNRGRAECRTLSSARRCSSESGGSSTVCRNYGGRMTPSAPMVRDLESRTPLPGSATRNTGLHTARILRLARAAGTYVSASLIGQLASAFPQHRKMARHSRCGISTLAP
jgi:hypothetical protein